MRRLKRYKRFGNSPINGPAIILLAALLLMTAAPAVLALTKVEGEYQIMIDSRKQYRSFPWDYDANNGDTWNGVNFRIFSAPFPNTEAFVKFEADWNPGSNEWENPVFQYRESHVRYRLDRDGYGGDVYLFQRQDRYWVENHLIQVVQSDKLKDSDNAQGARFDIWGLKGTNFTFIASDYSGQSNPGAGSQAGAPVGTDDAYVARLRRLFFNNDLRAGLTFNRRMEGQDADPDAYQGVMAGDLRYTWRNTDILLEYAESQSKNTPEHMYGVWHLRRMNLKHMENWLPPDAVLRGEIRSIRFGSPALGYYNIVPTFWYYGPGFVNPLGDGKKDEQGVWINTWYLIPQRAVTLSLNYTSTVNREFDKKHYTEFYGEIYTEYENGFTSKMSYSNRKTRDYGDPRYTDITTNKDLFAEIQVESSLAWMRVQGKIKNLGSSRRKELGSLETSVNLTDKLKLYGRYAFGNDPARLRKGLFTQLQYRPRGNMDIFLEYGPNWIGDTPDPVDDNDLAGSGDNQDLVKLIIKGYF